MFHMPSHIDRYEIKTLIAAGGMGSLYLARDTNPNTNRLVAVKLLLANLDSGDLRERFAREARALAALNHPNIVDIYDSGEFQGSPFIVMKSTTGWPSISAWMRSDTCMTAACASGFSSCGVLTIDGLGDGLSTTISSFHDRRLTRIVTSPAKYSLGVFFEHVTNLLNMRELEDEGKVMALADYAAPIADGDNPLMELVRVRNGAIETAASGHALRRTLARIHWRYSNEQFAYLAQRVVEKTCVDLAKDAAKLSGLSRLALAGGVVSNVKATRRVRLLPELEDIYVFPHMGDGGLALGAALVAASDSGTPIDLDLRHLDLGPAYADQEIEMALRAAGLCAPSVPDLAARVTDLLAEGRIVMWFQGRMEYGPRALGHRSVLARPDRPELRDRLNLVLKRRVWYQPFCPSMLESEGPRVFADWTGARNRSMTMAYQLADAFRGRLSGVASVDGTCRPQFVPDDETTAYADLLRSAGRTWGVAAVLNTSFNIHGEPLVCSPGEAIDVFKRSGADALAIGSFLVRAQGN